MNAAKVLLGTLVGIAVGAAVGVLFAPDKGTSTRKKISKRGSDYADGLGEKFDDFIENITDQFDALKKEATNITEKGNSKAKSALSEITSTTNSKV